jgi:thiol-disulfide isomerase/thioredoxin
MKPTDFLLFFILIFFSCQSPQKGFLIEGNIQGLDEGKLLLQRRIDGEFITIDSCLAQAGDFTFRGKMEVPEMCFIKIADTLPYLRFFNENSTISISSHIDSLSIPKVTGSASHQLLSDYNLRMKPYELNLQESYARFRQATQEQDTAGMNKHEAQFDQISEEQKAESLLFIGENNSSAVSAYLVWGTLAYDLEVEELEALSRQFSPGIRESVYVKQIDAYIETLNKVAIGQPFTEIALADTSGNVQRLSQLKGKLVLIDFWASWCGPCRRENPRVVAMYNEYRDKDFEIFGVSLDEDKSKWIKAINDDKLTWYHVSDLKGWNSEAGKSYGIRSIPHTVLVDKNGIIVARNLRGEELREKIRALTEG